MSVITQVRVVYFIKGFHPQCFRRTLYFQVLMSCGADSYRRVRYSSKMVSNLLKFLALSLILAIKSGRHCDFQGIT